MRLFTGTFMSLQLYRTLKFGNHKSWFNDRSDFSLIRMFEGPFDPDGIYRSIWGDVMLDGNLTYMRVSGWWVPIFQEKALVEFQNNLWFINEYAFDRCKLTNPHGYSIWANTNDLKPPNLASLTSDDHAWAVLHTLLYPQEL